MHNSMERNTERWRQRKRRKQCIIVILILAMVMAIFLALILGVKYCKMDRKEADVCLTPECIRTASNVLKWMDPSIDPCDDFYDFACGNFIKNAKIPNAESSISTSTKSDDLVVEQMRSLIEEPIQDNEARPFTLIKKLYKVCMNKTLIEEIGLKEIKELIRSFGGWPVLEGANWNHDDFDWKKTIWKFEEAGFYTDYLLGFTVVVDEKNSSRRVLNLDQAFLVLSKELLEQGVNDELVQAYHSYMVDIAVTFGANKETAYNEMLEVINFDIKLANISDSNEDRRDSVALYNPMTIKELQAKYTSIDWLQYINELLSPHESATDDEIVVVASPKYLEKFEKLIAVTDKRVQANYLIWRAVAFTISYLPDKLRDKQLKFTTVLTGETEMVERWKECVNHCTSSLDIAADAMYVRKYFKKDARNTAEELVANIRAQFREILKNVDWMDKKTRKQALKKADMMVTHIGYPIELLDDTKLEEFYQDLEINGESYLKSSLNVSLFSNKASFKKLHLPVNKTEWTSHSDTTAVNAFYSPNENSIQFPAGILQGVYFNHDRPNYMNYGGIGFIIGHEITHGFDDDGRKYDIEGNLENWWVQETETAFLKKAQCIIDQYSNYTAPEVGIKLNGVTMLGENIADNGGVKQAYLAYDRLIQKIGEEPRLPGLHYTGRQMFWISAANIWCSKTRPEVLKQRLAEDFHAPDRFRVLGPLSNLKDFAKDFKCKPGTRMNPKHKCYLW